MLLEIASVSGGLPEVVSIGVVAVALVSLLGVILRMNDSAQKRRDAQIEGFQARRETLIAGLIEKQGAMTHELALMHQTIGEHTRHAEAVTRVLQEIQVALARMNGRART